MSIDELIVESAITKEMKTVSAIDTEKLKVFSEITKELTVKVPVEIELI